MVATAEALYPQYLKEEFERFGVKIMREAHTSPYHLLNNKPVRTLADVQGMKVRAGGGVHAQIIGALDPWLTADHTTHTHKLARRLLQTHRDPIAQARLVRLPPLVEIVPPGMEAQPVDEGLLSRLRGWLGWQ